MIQLYRLCLFIILFFMSVTLPVTGATQEENGPNLVIIFDASGSMWGQISGTPKISIAKEAMQGIVKDLPEKIRVGLVAYGHREKGDCDDVQTLVPLGAIDRKLILDKVNGISPKGKTPIVRSVKKTAESIKHLEDRTTILLISDGEETCDPDPCGFVKELKDAGINFVMHVVGFDVGGEVEAQLKCMAKASGGEYFSASGADHLKTALNTVVKKTVSRNLLVSGFNSADNPISARVRVLNPSGQVIDSDAGKNVGFSLPPGEYTIRVNPETMSQTITLKEVIVTKDQVTRKKVVFNDAGVSVGLKDHADKPVTGYIRIIDSSTGQMADGKDHGKKPVRFIVSPGRYYLQMECSLTGIKILTDSFDLVPGENKTMTGVCAKARIGVLVKGEGGKILTGYVRIVDVQKDSYADEADSAPSMKFFSVPAGQYRVDVECPGEQRVRSEVFKIAPGQEVKTEINCQSKTGVVLSQ